MGFSIFGKRRRQGHAAAPDEELAADASRASDDAAKAQPAQPAKPAKPAPPVLEGDLAMPRWRRPSLLAARKADPASTAPPIVPLTFAETADGPSEGVERRQIRYHVVDLLDAPDELRSGSIGSLTHGDEVQLIECSGSYRRVLCPDGRQGWIHRMTLGAVVGAEPVGPADT